MSVPLYEFTGEHPGRPRRKWLIAVLLCPAVAAVIWGIVVLERRGAEALVQQSFELRTGLHNNVIAAIARVPDVQEEGLEFLSQYPRLQKIDLSGTRTVPGGLRSLLQIDDLRVLDLRDCAWVDDEQAEWLAELKGLKRLDVSGTSVTDAALRAVSALPRLRDLKMEGCQGVTDAGLEVCAGMPQLRELWPGGAGYSIDGLFALRERRRDLNLQLHPSDVAGRGRRDSESAIPVVADPAVLSFVETGPHFQTSISAQPGVEMTLSTAANIEALSDLLRFPQDWSVSGHDDRTPLRNVREVRKSNYLEHIEEKWTLLDLHGPAAGASLSEVFPLTPKLVDLRLQDTTITTGHFPFELVPPGLRRLSIENTPVSASFLQVLGEHTTLEELWLIDVAIDGFDYSEAKITSSVDFPVDHGALTGLRTLHIKNKPVGNSFLQVLSEFTALEGVRLTDVAISEVQPHADAILTREDFSLGRWFPELRSLSVENMPVSESFLQSLSQHTALERLSLTEVAVEGVDHSDPALGHLTSLRSMHLQNVTFDGVAITDPALKPLARRLREQLSKVYLEVYTTSEDVYLQWHNLGE